MRIVRGMGACERLIAHAVLLGAWTLEGDPLLGGTALRMNVFLMQCSMEGLDECGDR